MFGIFWKKNNYDNDNYDYDSDENINIETETQSIYDIESASYLKNKESKKEYSSSTLPNLKIDTKMEIKTSPSINNLITGELKKQPSENSLSSIQNNLADNHIITPVSTPVSTPTSTPVNKRNVSTDSNPSVNFINIAGSTSTINQISTNKNKVNQVSQVNQLNPNIIIDETAIDYFNKKMIKEPESEPEIRLYNNTMNKINNLTSYKESSLSEKSEKKLDKKELKELKELTDDSVQSDSSVKSANSDISEYDDNTISEYESDEEENEELKDTFKNYIIKESIRTYNHNSYYCQFLWSGISHLDHWELQRKVNKDHARAILKQMKKDYEVNKKFTFYDVIHLGRKANDDTYYVLDGQHRLIAYDNLHIRNLYPIQKVPAVIWETNSDEEFLEIYERINKRVPFDITPFNKKILDVIFQMDNTFGKGTNIWGKKRPKLDKVLFIDEMKTNDSIHKLDADTIVKKLIEINVKIRGLPRSKRTNDKVSGQVHTNAEEIDFFLGYDKSLKWIHEIKF